MIWTLFLIQFFAVASPGPDFLITIRTAVGGSHRAVMGVASGITLANAIHIAYCLAGIGVLISHSILLFSLIKWAGASYLLFLGISALLSKKSPPLELSKNVKSEKTFGAGFKTGFLVSLFNPKAALYYATLFSVFLDPQSFSLAGIFGFLVGILSIVFVWFLAVGFFFADNRIAGLFSRFRFFLDKILGAILVFLGIRLFAFSRS